MKIILTQSVKGLGEAGEMVSAKDGYARNFLMPKGLAVEATAENVAEWKVKQAERKALEQKKLEAAKKLKEFFDEQTMEMRCKGGEGGRLFGSVTTQDVADAIKENYKVEIDKKRIELPEQIKTVGPKKVVLKLHPDVKSEFIINVISE